MARKVLAVGGGLECRKQRDYISSAHRRGGGRGRKRKRREQKLGSV